MRSSETIPFIETNLTDDQVEAQRTSIQEKITALDLQSAKNQCKDAWEDTAKNCIGVGLIGGAVGVPPLVAGITNANLGATIAGGSILGCTGGVALANCVYGLFYVGKLLSKQNAQKKFEEELNSLPKPKFMTNQ